MMWDERYQIDVAFIDEQHQEWFSRVAKLGAAIDRGKANVEMANTLKYVVSYTQKHFADEEAYMAEVQYPGLDAQKKLHRDFEKYIVDVLVNLKRGKAVPPANVYTFMANWIKQHIEEEDRQIRLFLSQSDTGEPPDKGAEEHLQDGLALKLGELAELLSAELITEADFASKKQDLLLKFATAPTGKDQVDTLAKLAQLKELIGENLLTEADLEAGKVQLAKTVNVNKELTLHEGYKAKMIHLKKLLDEAVVSSETFESVKAEILSQM